jgi:hypothetical protein
VDRPPAEERDDGVARLLDPQALLDHVLVVFGHLDRTRVAEEIRRVQEEQMEPVALDPLAAVEQSAQAADGRARDEAEGALNRAHGAHLVGDRADAADPRDDVGDLPDPAAAQEGLEEPRRLEDRQARLLDHAAPCAQVERALPLHAGKHVDLVDPLLSAHAARSLCGRPRPTR